MFRERDPADSLALQHASGLNSTLSKPLGLRGHFSMFDGVVPPASRSAVVYRADGAHWRPRFGRSVLCAGLKRTFDVLAAASVLLFLAPAYLAISILIALDSPGPILFRQQRTGLNGRVFTIYKFRSMTVAEPGASVSHATREDARVTRVGRILRETSLDEIPQLLNVLC